MMSKKDALPGMYCLPKPAENQLITVKEFGRHISAAAILQEFRQMYIHLDENEGSEEELDYFGRLKMRWWWCTGSPQDVRDFYANLPKKVEED
jgi:hypothetical protein